MTLAPSVTVRRITHGPRHYTCGYFDESPWDVQGRYVLALAALFCDRAPRPDDVATLGVVDLEVDSFHPFAETRAWNWQQGCRLQWLPPGYNRHVIYNDREGDHFVSIICDPFTGRIVRRLPLPIYAISHDGRQAVTLNFARLYHQRPGYGYAGVVDPWRSEFEPEDDGIYRLDLETGEYQLIFSAAQAARACRRESMVGAVHRFNHLQFSPDDGRVVFLHRWRHPQSGSASLARRVTGAARGTLRMLSQDDEYNGASLALRLRLGVKGLRRLVGRGYGTDVVGLTRLWTARPDGSDARIGFDEEVVSHFDWRDPEHILAWARHNGSEGMFLLEPESGIAKPVNHSAMPADGHCSYSPGSARRWILNDTPPDRNNDRWLYIYDTLTSRRVDLGRFHSPPMLAGDFRCDLHPRWSRDGKRICIDSSHEGNRQIYIVDVSSILEE
jgi:hypothetical protein